MSLCVDEEFSAAAQLGETLVFRQVLEGDVSLRGSAAGDDLADVETERDDVIHDVG